MFQKALFTACFMLIPALAGCGGMPAGNITSPVYLEDGYHALAEQDTNRIVLMNDPRWWRIYDDPQLGGLMAQAFARNPGINQIRARLAQSRALAKQGEAALFPTLDVSGERGATRGDNAAPSDFTLSGAARFELDLWGGNRAARNADGLEAQAGAEDLYAATVTLSASIVEAWLDLLSLQEQKALLLKQIDINRTVLELQHKRFEMGAAWSAGYFAAGRNSGRSASRTARYCRRPKTGGECACIAHRKNPL